MVSSSTVHDSVVGTVATLTQLFVDDAEESDIGTTEEEKRETTTAVIEALVINNAGTLSGKKLFIDETVELPGFDLSSSEVTSKTIRVLSTKSNSSLDNEITVEDIDETNVFLVMDEADTITLPTISSTVDIVKTAFDADTSISSYTVTHDSLVYSLSSGDTQTFDGLTLIMGSIIASLDRPVANQVQSRLVTPDDILVDGEYVTDSFMTASTYGDSLRGETIEEQRESLILEQSLFFAQNPDVVVRYTNRSFFSEDVIMNSPTYLEGVKYCTFSSIQFLANSYDSVYSTLLSDGTIDGVAGSADVQHINIQSTAEWTGAAYFSWSYRTMDIPEFYSFIDLDTRLAASGNVPRVGDMHIGCADSSVFDTSTILSTVTFTDKDIETMESMFGKLIDIAGTTGSEKVDVDTPCLIASNSFILTSNPTEPDFFDESYPTAVFKCETAMTCYNVQYNSTFTVIKSNGQFSVNLGGIEYVFAENDEGMAGTVHIKTSINYVAVTIGSYSFTTKTHDEMVVSTTQTGNDNINSVNILRYDRMFLTTAEDYGKYIYGDGRTEYFSYTRGYKDIVYSEPVRIRYMRIGWTGQYSGKKGNTFLILGSNDGTNWEHFLDYNSGFVPGKQYSGQQNSNIRKSANPHMYSHNVIDFNSDNTTMDSFRTSIGDYLSYKVRPWWQSVGGSVQAQSPYNTEIPYLNSYMAVSKFSRGPTDSMSMLTYTLEIGHGDHALNGLPNNGRYYTHYRVYIVDGWISIAEFETDDWILDVRQ